MYPALRSEPWKNSGPRWRTDGNIERPESEAFRAFYIVHIGLRQQYGKLVFVGLSPNLLSLRDQCAHWLAMTAFFECAFSNTSFPLCLVEFISPFYSFRTLNWSAEAIRDWPWGVMIPVKKERHR